MLVSFLNSCAVFYKPMTIFCYKIRLWGQEHGHVSAQTHRAVQLYPVNLIAGADSRLLGL